MPITFGQYLTLILVLMLYGCSSNLPKGGDVNEVPPSSSSSVHSPSWPSGPSSYRVQDVVHAMS